MSTCWWCNQEAGWWGICWLYTACTAWSYRRGLFSQENVEGRGKEGKRPQDQSSCSQSHLWHRDSSDYCGYCQMEKCHQHYRQHCYYIWQHIFCWHVHSWQSSVDHQRGNPNAVKSQELDYLVWWWHNKGSRINIHNSHYHSSSSAGILDQRKWSIRHVT